MTTDEKLDLIAVQTEDGSMYVAERENVGSRRRYNMPDFLFDGKEPERTFRPEWAKVGATPQRITKMIRQPNISHRYELQDKTLISNRLPEYVEREAIATKVDGEWEWNEDMRQYRSLYVEISDKQPDKEIEYHFNLDVVLEVAQVVNPVEMSYSVKSQNRKQLITEDSAKYQLLDKVIFPDIILPQRPCRLSSQQTYKIIRQYIRDNIDPKVVEITSHYDFCFTVKKRIRLATVKKFTVDVNNNLLQKRKRKPKFVEQKQTGRKETCFEMTYSPYNYKGYTSIKGFEANTQKELKEKIDVYCEQLIAFINTPIVECSHCDGNGIVS